jgi:hypothetical protein
MQVNMYLVSGHTFEGGLSDVTKFSYLRCLLQGSAADIISGLPLTSDAYAHAIDRHKARYGDKHETRRALYEKLRVLKPAKYDTEGLTKMLD